LSSLSTLSCLTGSALGFRRGSPPRIVRGSTGDRPELDGRTAHQNGHKNSHDAETFPGHNRTYAPFQYGVYRRLELIDSGLTAYGARLTANGSRLTAR